MMRAGISKFRIGCGDRDMYECVIVTVMHRGGAM